LRKYTSQLETIAMSSNSEIKRTTENPFSLCGCYKNDSPDSRFCGLCYCLYRNNDLNDRQFQCYICPVDVNEYCNSGYIQTKDGYGYGNSKEGNTNICCTCACFPIKFPLFFPCLLGSLMNHSLNKCCSPPYNRNYLC